MAKTSSAWRPERAVEIIAGTPPGGGLDRTARALAQVIEAQRLLDVPVKVVNVPGDGSRKAWIYLDRFQHDPHVLSVSSPNVTTDHLTGLTTFDHDTYTPLAIVHNEYIAFVARADSPLKSSAELLKRLGADAGAVTIALATSRGNPNHIALARVTRHAGGEVRALTVRAFDSARDAVAAVMVGKADVGAVTAASAVPELADGSLRALAVTAPGRLAGLYEKTPTWLEQSVGCVIGAWRGVNGAHGLSPEQIAYWDGVLAKATACAEWNAEVRRHYWTAMYVGSVGLREYLPRERAEMKAMLGELGLLH